MIGQNSLFINTYLIAYIDTYVTGIYKNYSYPENAFREQSAYMIILSNAPHSFKDHFLLKFSLWLFLVWNTSEAPV